MAQKKTYTEEQKAEILKKASESSITEASKEFGVDRKTIRSWKASDSLAADAIEAKKKTRAAGRKVRDALTTAAEEPTIIAQGNCGAEGDGTNLTWVLTDDGNTVVLEAEGHTLALLNEASGIAATVDAKELTVTDADFDFGEGHFIDAEFLAGALNGEAVWEEEENTLMLKIPEAK